MENSFQSHLGRQVCIPKFRSFQKGLHNPSITFNIFYWQKKNPYQITWAFILCWKHCAIILPFFRTATCAAKTNWDVKERTVWNSLYKPPRWKCDYPPIWGKSLKFMGQTSSYFLEAVQRIETGIANGVYCFSHPEPWVV